MDNRNLSREKRKRLRKNRRDSCAEYKIKRSRNILIALPPCFPCSNILSRHSKMVYLKEIRNTFRAAGLFHF